MVWLVTGVTGFLGRHIARRLVRDGEIVVGLARSESKLVTLGKELPESKLFTGSVQDQALIERLIKTHGVSKIIHCAALKHIKTCQDQPTACVETNILGTLSVLRAARCAAGVEDVVVISTDKANNPACVYGMSKHIVEKMALEHGARVFQGANFLWSDGSVLDVWNQQRARGETLVANRGMTRHFCTIDDACDAILTSTLPRIETPQTYRIRIEDLLRVYAGIYGYNNINFRGSALECEKSEEIVMDGTPCHAPDRAEIQRLISQSAPSSSSHSDRLADSM